MNDKAIVYSIYIDNDSIFDNKHYRQLLYSIKTLRSYSNIPVIVYINDISLLYKSSRKTIKDFYYNINFIEYNSSDYACIKPEITSYPWPRINNVIHKWPNACKAFKDYNNLDHILYVDCDTIFYRNIDDIFDIYNNGLYIREEWVGFNDGVFILNKSTAEYIDSFYIKNYSLFRESFIEKHVSSGICSSDKIVWVAYQHASYDLFKFMDINIKYLDKSHVRKIDDEEKRYWNEEQFNDGNLFLMHYFFNNFKRCVPKSHW